ncbi:hypothetical protein [Burkholderia vietnamiensis]|uniref:hypothetical protein n=1 Tax=Burkholderia vietnamiensis TaxID=60552 RepID=UPI0027E1B874|nr:hypothetical protein [Burkholderia vietnamiensis]
MCARQLAGVPKDAFQFRDLRAKAGTDKTELAGDIRVVQRQLTAYVDDVTISGPVATKKLLGEVRKVVSRFGYKTKQKKSKTYAVTSVKAVTGAVVVERELRLPNERHRKIWRTKQELLRCGGEEKAKLMRALKGRLQAGSKSDSGQPWRGAAWLRFAMQV